MSQTDLGFAEECEPWEVESRLFPSKVGGKPAWLNLENLPNAQELQCEECKQQMIFLCQIYAPYEEDDANFHRTLFIFVCRSESCCKNSAASFKVFRSTLQRFNKFYPSTPPKHNPDSSFTLSKWVNLCVVCGISADKHCGKCKEAAYCSREHQIFDWKQRHKEVCGSNTIQQNSSKLFSEFEIVMDSEEIQEKVVDEQEELEKFRQLTAEGKTGTLNDVTENELDKYAQPCNVDKAFSQFKKRISSQPDQIVRYCRGGAPLWIADVPKPKQIPDCEYCSSARQFEFQIMPQMLTILKEIKLDWGVLVIYTCKNSCTNGSDYKKEFIFKQDVADESMQAT